MRILKATKLTDNSYDKMLLDRMLSKDINFRWCLSPNCGNGQVYYMVDTSFPLIFCRECQFKMCFTHQKPWHEALTCEEFDRSIAEGDPGFTKTRKYITDMTKPCPACNVRIEKNAGCFHMTCKLSGSGSAL